MKQADIRKKYKRLHDDLTECFYQRGEMSQSEFDAEHHRMWADIEVELKLADDYVEPGLSETDMILQRIAELEKRVTSIEAHFGKE